MYQLSPSFLQLLPSVPLAASGWESSVDFTPKFFIISGKGNDYEKMTHQDNGEPEVPNWDDNVPEGTHAIDPPAPYGDKGYWGRRGEGDPRKRVVEPMNLNSPIRGKGATTNSRNPNGHCWLAFQCQAKPSWK